MDNKQIFFLLLLSVFIFSGCHKAPEFPFTPKINFEKVTFKAIEGSADSLIIWVNFEDGDGDLGLANDETNTQYQERFYFSPTDGSVVLEPDDNFTNIITFGGFDDLGNAVRMPNIDPDTLSNDFEFPFNCSTYSVDTNLVGDNIISYYQINQNHYNIEVDFLVKKDGQFIQFDWRQEFCTTFDGRFPHVNLEGNERALEGTIKYSMLSNGFLAIPDFRLFPTKLRVEIKDRALNKSNIVESPVFVLTADGIEFLPEDD